MSKEIFQNRVSVLPAIGIPNYIYYVPNGNGDDLDEYLADNNGILRKVRNIPSISVSAGTSSSDLSTIIFSNSPTVTFGLNGSVITASAIGGGGGGGAISVSAGVSSEVASQIVLSNSNNFSFGLSNGTITGSYTVPTDYISTGQSSLFQLTSDNSLSLGTGYTTHTHSQYLNTSQSSVFLTSQTVQPVAASGSNGSFLFSTISFGNLNGLSHYTSNGSIVGSYTVPTDYISTAQSSLFQLTVDMTDYLDTSYTTHTHDYILTNQSSIFQLTADNSLSLGTGYTTHTHNQYVNTSQSSLFEQSSHTTIFLTTAMLSNASTAFVNTSQSSLFQQTSQMSDYQTTGAYLTTAMASNRGSDFVQANAVFNGTNASGTIASDGISISVAAQSAQTGISSLILSNTTYTSGAASFRDGNGISWASTTGQGISITHGLQHTSNTSAITSNAFNTSGSSNFVLTANSSLLQHTSATSAITSNALHTSVARIQGIIGSNTTYTSGSVSLRDLNGISWQSTTGQAFQITHALQHTSNTSDITSNAFNTSGSSNFVLTANSSLLQHTSATSAITSNALNTSQSSLFRHTSQNSQLQFTSAMSDYLGTAQSSKYVQNWKITGNTAGTTSSAQGTDLWLAGGNGVTISGSSNTLSFSVATNYQSQGAYLTTAALSQDSSKYAGTGVTTAGGVGFSATLNTAGLSVSIPTWLTTAALSNHSHGDPTLALTNLSGTTASASNGFTISLSANVAGGAQTGISSIAISDTTYTSGQISFRDGNGISWASGTGQGISATHALQYTSATSAITSNAFNTSGSSNFVLTANSSLLQHTSATSAITSAAVHTSSPRIQGIIGSDTTYITGNVSLRDLNGITWQSTTGQAFQITHALQYTSATSAITSNAFNTSGSSNFVLTANSSLLQHTSATSAITSAALHTSASRVMNIIAATNSTGGGTASLSSNVSFSNTNNFTFYTSVGGAIVASFFDTNKAGTGVTTAGGAGFSGTLNSAGLSVSIPTWLTTAMASNRGSDFVQATAAFAGTNASGTIASNGISVSVAAPGAAAENNWVNLLGANTAGNTTASGSTIGWSGVNLTLSGTNGSVVNISAPGTSSLSGTGQVSISVNGSTISIGVPNAVTVSRYNEFKESPLVQGQIGNASLHLQPWLIPNLQFDRVVVHKMFSNASNSSFSFTVSDWVGIYTQNVSTLSLLHSVSASTNFSGSGTAGSYLSYGGGIKAVTMGLTQTLTEGMYWIGVINRTTTGGGAGHTLDQALNSNLNSSYRGLMGAATNATNQMSLGFGVYTASTSGMPASIAFTQINGNSSVFLRPPSLYFISGTI